MDAERKVIEGVLPVTTTKAVFIDGTKKTLQEAIDNGELGGSANVDIDQSNLIWDIFMQNGSISFPRIDLFTKEVDIQLDSMAPTDQAVRLMPVIMADGTTKAAASSLGLTTASDIYTLQNGESLVYDSSTNTTQITTSFVTNGSKKLLAYNNSGNIAAGLFKPFFERHFHMYIDKYLNVSMTPIPNVAYFHSMFIMGNKLVTLEVSSLGMSNVYDLTNLDNNTINQIGSFQVEFLGTNSNGDEYELRLVAADYSEENQALVFGNSVGTGDELPDYTEAHIFYEVENWLSSTETINYGNCGSFTKVIFNDNLLGSLLQGKVCWDKSSSNCLWLTTDNGKRIFRILLGKGTNQLENGVYSYIDNDKFNGTYKILSYWYNQIHDFGCKDLVHANGSIIYPIKKTTGGIYFQKVQMCHDGNTSVRVERFHYNPVDDSGNPSITGSPEGIVHYNGKLILGHASYKYFYVIDANI